MRWRRAICWLFGCGLRHAGGANAGCELDGCACSIPIYRCYRCGCYDYGDNAEARKIRANCAEERAWQGWADV